LSLSLDLRRPVKSVATCGSGWLEGGGALVAHPAKAAASAKTAKPRQSKIRFLRNSLIL
jgi:hypothetical protein